MRKLFERAVVTAVLILAAVVPAQSFAGQNRREDVVIEIVSDNRGNLPAIPHERSTSNGVSEIRRYVEARAGENYGIRVRNNTAGRIGLVIAVDGRNIIDGSRSILGSREAMYVLNAREDALYDGWRTGRDRVNRFYFTDTRDSYSVRTFNDVSALGVIAVAVYREKVFRPFMRREPAPQASPKQEKRGLADESAATGFGEELYSPVTTVQFSPESRPFLKNLIRYEWRETLCRNGVLRCGQERKSRLWDREEYAPCPPGYPGS